MSFHTDHLHPNTGVGNWSLFLSENIVSLLRRSQRRDTETLQFCRTNEGDPPVRVRRGFCLSLQVCCLFESELCFDPTHCTASLYNLQEKRLLLHCTGKRRLLVKPPAWLAFNIFHILGFGSPNYFPFCFRVQEQLVKEISCSAAITLLKWPLNSTALLSAKPNRSSTLRYPMSMFLVCLEVHFLQCNMLKSQVSNVRKTKHCWVTSTSFLLTQYL